MSKGSASAADALRSLRDEAIDCEIAGQSFSIRRPSPESLRAVQEEYRALGMAQSKKSRSDEDLMAAARQSELLLAKAVSAVTDLPEDEAEELLHYALAAKSDLPATAARFCGISRICKGVEFAYADGTDDELLEAVKEMRREGSMADPRPT